MQNPLAPQVTCPSGFPLCVGSQQASRNKDPRATATPKYEGLCFSPWHLIDSFPHLRTFLFEMRPNTYANIT